jgi:hypothetical protein
VITGKSTVRGAFGQSKNKYSTTPNRAAETFIPKTLNFHTTRLITASASKSTWDKHSSAMACFHLYEHYSNSKHDFPLKENTICDFIDFAFRIRGLKQATVNSYLSSLHFYHKLRKMDDSGFSSFIVKTMLKGAKNLEFYSDLTKDSRRALTFPLLKILGHEIALKNWDEMKKQVIWTAMLTAFFGSFRLGEILSKYENSFNVNETLLWKDVVFSKGVVTITIKIPKTRKTSVEFIDLFSFPDTRYCPILALKKLKTMQSTHTAEAPVFALTENTMLTPTAMTQTLRTLLEPHLGAEAALFSGHSFRAALPSALASCPEVSSDESIKSWGRWTSGSFRLYTRLKLNQRKHIFNKIVQSLRLNK